MNKFKMNNGLNKVLSNKIKLKDSGLSKREMLNVELI